MSDSMIKKKMQKPQFPGYTAFPLYDAEKVTDLLNGLTPVMCSTEDITVSHDAENSKRDESPGRLNHIVPERKSCSLCGLEFEVRSEQKQHFKSDWHLFNLKKRIRSETPVTEDAFEVLAAGDISSLSGSDSTDTDEEHSSEVTRIKSPVSRRLKKLKGRSSSPASTDSDSDSSQGSTGGQGYLRRQPKVYFRNQKGDLLSMYKCIMHGKKNEPDTFTDLLSLAMEIPNRLNVAILLTGGGHFAGAIYSGATLISHKTFHRYVVRAKRGTAQSARDSQGNAPKSAGASLRRHNEAALTQEIQELLESWTDQLQKCNTIFIRTPTYNRGIFFGGKKSPIVKGDIRLRTIPFATRRATFSEVKRVHEVLLTVKSFGPDADLGDIIKPPLLTRSRGEIENKQLHFTENINTTQSPKASHRKKMLDKFHDSEKSSASGTNSEAELEMVQEIISTLDLQEFDSTKPKKRKKTGKKKLQESLMDENTKPESSIHGSELNIKNLLYTACKTGDVEALRNILTVDKSSCHGNCVDSKGTKDANISQDAEQTLHLNKTSDNICATTVEVENVCTATAGEENIYNTASVSICITSLNKNAKTNLSLETSAAKTGDIIKNVLKERMNNDAETLLHISARQGHKEIVFLLLEFGADPGIRNVKGQTPYLVSKDKPMRNEFRKFRAQHPEMYDYETAQIPEPLSEEADAQKRVREAERRKIQKKAKKERLKDQKLLEAKEREEERDKQRYLQLSDREKRALAAERRFTKQKGDAVPVLSRCFQCAADMTGKVPFEYYDYKFCSTKCLREHKLKTTADKS